MEVEVADNLGMTEALEKIRTLESTVAGYKGTRVEDRQTIEELRAQLNNMQKNYTAMSEALEEVNQQLPGLIAAQKQSARLEQLADYPDILGNQPLRRILLSSGLDDGELMELVSGLVTRNDKQGVEPETIPEPTSKPDPESEPKPDPTPEPEPEPEPEVLDIKGPPAINQPFSEGGTTSDVKANIQAAIKAGDFNKVRELTESWARLLT